MIGVVSCVDGTGINMFNSLVANSNTCDTSSNNQIKVVVENTVSGTVTSWNIYNYTQTGISICNATPDGSTAKSQTTTAPPLMRVAQGNFSLWSANERWQCNWREDTTSPAESTDPSATSHQWQSGGLERYLGKFNRPQQDDDV